MTQYSLSKPFVEDSAVVFDEFIRLKKERLRYANGYIHQYYSIATKANAVVIIASTAERQFILTEEYRHPTGSFLLSCPGGYLDPGENPTEAGLRELLEETGYSAFDCRLMGQAYPFPGLCGQCVYFVRAENAIKIAEPSHEHSEVIKVVLKDSSSVNANILSGKNVDGILCSALYYHHISSLPKG